MLYPDSERSLFIQRDIFGKQFEGVGFGSIHTTGEGKERTFQRVYEWMQNPKYMLIYAGGYGIGKTTLAAAMVPWALSTFKSVRFITETLFLQKIKRQMSMEEGDCTKEIFHLCDNEFFLFDDLGSERVKEDGTTWKPMGVMIDHRWSSGLPTVITTNLSDGEILENYGGRVHSRLFDARNTIIEDRDSHDNRLSR